MSGQEQRRSDLNPADAEPPKLKGNRVGDKEKEPDQKREIPPITPKNDMGRYKGRGFRPQNVW